MAFLIRKWSTVGNAKKAMKQKAKSFSIKSQPIVVTSLTIMSNWKVIKSESNYEQTNKQSNFCVQR